MQSSLPTSRYPSIYTSEISQPQSAQGYITVFVR
jgi:hypothetical protein